MRGCGNRACPARLPAWLHPTPPSLPACGGGRAHLCRHDGGRRAHLCAQASRPLAHPPIFLSSLQAVEGTHTFAVKMEDGTLIFAHAGHGGSIPGNEELIAHIRAAGAGEAGGRQ